MDDVSTIFDGYNEITLYGGQSINYLWVRNEIATQSQINAVNNSLFIPQWIMPWDEEDLNACPPIINYKTLLLANYKESINGGQAWRYGESQASGWLVYRINIEKKKLDFVKEIDINETDISDYMIGNYNEYQYLIFINDIDGTNIISTISPKIIPDFNNWSLIGMKNTDDKRLFYADDNNIWHLMLQFKSGEQTHNIDKYTYDGLSKYPKISQGEKSYMSGSITCLFNTIDNNTYEHANSFALQRKFKQFCLDGNLKLLRDMNGNIYIIDIISDSFEYIDEIGSQPTYVTFDWVEVMSHENISVIDKEIKENKM